MASLAADDPHDLALALLRDRQVVEPLPAPPAAYDDSADASSWVQAVLPLVGSVGMFAIVLVRPQPVYLVMGSVWMLGSLLASVVTRRARRQRVRQRIRKMRIDYVHSLQRAVDEARERQASAVRDLHDLFPGMPFVVRPAADVAGGDGLFLRIGTRLSSVPYPLAMPADEVRGADPVCNRALLDTYDKAAGKCQLPFLVSGASALLHFSGADAAECANALVLAVCRALPPDQISIRTRTDEAGQERWSWLRWLPHAAADGGLDVIGADDNLVGTQRARTSTAHSLDVTDLVIHGATEGVDVAVSATGASVRREQVDVVCSGDTATVTSRGWSVDGVFLDRVPAELAGTCSRSVARAWQRNAFRTRGDSLVVPPLGALARITRTPKLDSDPTLLTTPIGVTDAGEVLTLNLREAARGGLGPHGFIVGATGSGKSELLKSIVTGLASDHHPDDVTFLLIDFKGGAAFRRLDQLPHVCGVVTNLYQDVSLIERVAAAMRGELRRRQELLARHGAKDIHEYRTQRAVDDEPMPYLLIVIDEFSELADSAPHWAPFLASAGRIGRSLGVHLLLSSQRFEPGKLRDVEPHLSYRIALRTFNSVDSQAAIGSSLAATLPSEPGHAFITGAGRIDRFRVSSTEGQTAPGFSEPIVAHPAPKELVARASDAIQVAVDQWQTVDRRAMRSLWLPPLPQRLAWSAADAIAAPLRAGDEPGLLAVLGVIDDPEGQRYLPLVENFDRGPGNVLVLGAPRSGKTTALRTLVTALASTYRPNQVHMYVVDESAGLSSLHLLAHVGDVIISSDVSKVRRLFFTCLRIMDTRLALMRGLEVDSIQQLRRTLKEDGVRNESMMAPTLVVVDGVAGVLAQAPDLVEQVRRVLTDGPRLGVHLAASATAVRELPPELRTAFGSRLELRLGDAAESSIDTRAAAGLARVPGRGLTVGPRQIQIALPVAIEEAAAAQPSCSSGLPPSVGVLPDHASMEQASAGPGVGLGLAEDDLAPVSFDIVGEQSHLVVVGESESGKTSFLKAYLRQLCAQYTPQSLELAIIDFRLDLIDCVPEAYEPRIAMSPETAAQLVSELAARLADRFPNEHTSIADLRKRSWWSGSHIVLVVDDLDIVTDIDGFGTDLFAPLKSAVRSGRDLGFHVVAARSDAQLARGTRSALLAPLLQIHSPTLLMSSNATEGPWVDGTKLGPLPQGRARLLVHRQPARVVQLAQSMPIDRGHVGHSGGALDHDAAEHRST